ncbi:hypothetical protein D3C71_20030 [compost metagenome]
MPKPIVALDCDGVMLHYQSVFPAVWKEAFGEDIRVVRPTCYQATDMFGVSFKDAEHERRFYDTFDHRYWGGMTALEGALEACELLCDSGFRLVCVTAMPARYREARSENLQRLGFPIEDVIATGGRSDGDPNANPKLAALQALRPVAFVDDRLDNFEGVGDLTHCAWIDGKHHDCPSAPYVERGWHHSAHGNLLDFAKMMCAERG